MELWEKRPDETGPAFAAFQSFRDMPPGERTLLGAYRSVKGPNKANVAGTWRAWIEKFQWRDRAEAYDRYQDDMARAELEARRLRARVEIADLGETMRKKAANAARMLVAVSQKVGEREGKDVWLLEVELKPQEIARLAEVGVDLEKWALGEEPAEPGVTVVNVMDGGDATQTLQRVLSSGDEKAKAALLQLIDARRALRDALENPAP